ncbi:MAG: hypothetical protein GEEBNDBF_00402 [bacterium]|nr:hypothetical protein [bacterium]
MTLPSQIGMIGALTILLWGLGWLSPLFAFSPGQALLLLVWGFAPWWALIPTTAIGGLLLFDTFGEAAAPLIGAIGICALAAIPLGHWMREGRGPARGLFLLPLFCCGPWYLWRLLLTYSDTSSRHLPWWPLGILSMVVLWGAMLFVREYQPRRRSYRLSDAPLLWRSDG